MRRSIAIILAIAGAVTWATPASADPPYREHLHIGGGYEETVPGDGGIDLESDGDILMDGTLGMGGTPQTGIALYSPSGSITLGKNEFYGVNAYFDSGWKFAEDGPNYGGYLTHFAAGGGQIATSTNSGNAGDSLTQFTVLAWTAPGVVTITNDLFVDGGDFVVGTAAAGNIGTTTNPNQIQLLTATTARLEGDLEFEDGDTFWTGDGSGIPYGSMYNDNGDITVTMGTSGTAVRIPSGFTQGQANLVTFQNARELVVTKAGRYKISWSISFNTLAGSNQDIEGHIGIDNAENAQGSAHRFIGTATDKGNMGGNAILDLAASAVVSLMMVNDTGTSNINVNHADLVIIMVGGT